MKIAIVYEMVPEETRLYVLDVSVEDWKWIKLCAGQYVNTVTCKGKKLEACMKLEKFLVGHEPSDVKSPVFAGDVDRIVVTGLLL
jgi:hypothetical protein